MHPTGGKASSEAADTRERKAPGGKASSGAAVMVASAPHAPPANRRAVKAERNESQSVGYRKRLRSTAPTQD